MYSVILDMRSAIDFFLVLRSWSLINICLSITVPKHLSLGTVEQIESSTLNLEIKLSHSIYDWAPIMIILVYRHLISDWSMVIHVLIPFINLFILISS